MRLPGKHDARFHRNNPSAETRNDGKPNRKQNRFLSVAWPVCWQIARRKETSVKRRKETKARGRCHQFKPANKIKISLFPKIQRNRIKPLIRLQFRQCKCLIMREIGEQFLCK